MLSAVRIEQDILDAKQYVRAAWSTTNGATGGANSVNVVGLIEAYIYDLVEPDQAARDMGLLLGPARKAWLASGNPQLVILASGQSIRPGRVGEVVPGRHAGDCASLGRRESQRSLTDGPITFRWIRSRF